MNVNNNVLNNALNEFNFNNLNSLTENDDGSGWFLLIGAVLIFVVFLAVALIFINKKRAGSPGPVDSGTGAPGGHGARTPVTVTQALATVPPDDGQTSLEIFVSMLGPLLLGIGIGLAPALITAAIKRLTASSKTLIKNQLKALRSFKAATRPQFAVRAVMRSTKKLLTQKLASLGLAARVHLGMVWGKALKAAGWTSERITQTLARRIGTEAAAKVAERSAARVAARLAATIETGPLMVAELALTAVSLGLDLSNTGGWLDIDERQTSDLLQERAIVEADLKNSYIGGFKNDAGVVDPTTAVGYYPLYWGPLDEMGDTVTSDGLDLFDVMIETKMYEMLIADEPDPFIVKLLEKVAIQYGVSSTDVEQLISASMLTDMTQDDYWGLYDRAFDSICLENGGVLIDTGIAGRAKQCSHASETTCHAQSPWVEGHGIISNEDKDVTYTEWRDRDFFNQNYTPASVPAGVAGACIVQDPTRHDMCTTEQICANYTCYNNEYVRNRGICQNKADLCDGFGVSYCPNMRQRGGSGGDCPTALNDTQADLGDYASILLPGETLPSCYKATGDNWAEFFLGSVIYRYFNSGEFIRDMVALPGSLEAAASTTPMLIGAAVLALSNPTGGTPNADEEYLGEAVQSYNPSDAPPAEDSAEQFFEEFGNGMEDFGNAIEGAFTPEDSGECFPGSSLVTLEDSSVIQLRDLKLGMKVLSQCPKSGKPVFSEVFMWLVRDIGIKGPYIKLTTSHGEILKLSSQHYVHVNDTLLSAQEVKLGDVVYIHDDKFEPSIVTKIENVFEDDAISPVTVTGNIVVNGVLASCVTTYEDIIGSSLPTVYFTKKMPPMMIHHWVFKTVFKYTGYKGVKFVKFLHKPLYIMAGLENAMSD